MVPCAHPASTKTAFLFVAENLASGNLELRDNADRVTGYSIRDDVIGGYDLRDADGRKRGVLIPNDAIGGLRFEPSPTGKAGGAACLQAICGTGGAETQGTR